MHNVIIAISRGLFRQSICHYIRAADRGIVLHEAASYEEAQSLAEKIAPSLMILSEDILESFSAVRCPAAVVLCTEKNEYGGKILLKAAFPPNISCKAFLSGIHAVLAGGNYFPQCSSEKFQPSMKMENSAGVNLTAREKEVLSYLVKGAANKDIARALDLQVVTVKLHVRSICKKLNVVNRTQAALAARENGWFQ
jgi:two-component system nitrate/nitrite response regulator NarL